MYLYHEHVSSILRSLKKGDLESRKTLYEITYNHLLYIAKRYVIDMKYCEDVVMEAYLRAFKYIDTYNVECDGYNWLCKIVQNTAYDFNGKVEISISLESLIADRLFCDCVNIDDCIESMNLTYVMSKLEHYEKMLIYYRFFEDLTFDQIAIKLKKGKSTVHKQYLRIMKDLEILLRD